MPPVEFDSWNTTLPSPRQAAVKRLAALEIGLAALGRSGRRVPHWSLDACLPRAPQGSARRQGVQQRDFSAWR